MVVLDSLCQSNKVIRKVTRDTKKDKKIKGKKNITWNQKLKVP
jgi:hypothetical protein